MESGSLNVCTILNWREKGERQASQDVARRSQIGVLRDITGAESKVQELRAVEGLCERYK